MVPSIIEDQHYLNLAVVVQLVSYH